MQRVGDVGGGDRWPGIAPTDLTAQPGSLLSQLRNRQWPPLPSAQSGLLPRGAGRTQHPPLWHVLPLGLFSPPI